MQCFAVISITLHVCVAFWVMFVGGIMERHTGRWYTGAMALWYPETVILFGSLGQFVSAELWYSDALAVWYPDNMITLMFVRCSFTARYCLAFWG